MTPHDPSAAAPFQATDAPVYRPFSGLAIASLVVACVYALTLSIIAIASYRAGTPPLLPDWMLVLPLVGLGTAVAARSQIRNSEGTRSGQGLAAWGWWISLLFGLAYVAVAVGTKLAVSFQAQRFGDAFFERLRQGRVYEAYLMTRPPAERKTENADDLERMWIRYGVGPRGELRGALPVFTEHDLVRLIERAGSRAQIKALGLREWPYEQGGFQVQESYRLTTPEGTFVFLLGLRSINSREFAGPQWQIVWRNDAQFESRDLTSLGQALETWGHTSARSSAQRWLDERQTGHLVRSFLETVRPADREVVSRRYNAVAAGCAVGGVIPGKGVVGACLAPWLVSGAARRGGLPGYAAYSEGDLVHTKDFIGATRTRAAMIAEIKRHFLDATRIEIKLRAQSPGYPLPFSDRADQIRMGQEIDIRGLEPGPAGQAEELFRCEGILVLESDPGEIDAARQPRWRLVGLDLLRGGPPPGSIIRQSTE